MPFIIQYADDFGTIQKRTLDPSPSAVDYPADREAITVLNSVDGHAIIQRPLRDGRARKWIFQGWRYDSEPYASQWKWLEQQTTSYRMSLGLDPYVGIWENVTGLNGFDRVTLLGERVFTRVRIVQATREIIQRGRPHYDSYLTFYIADDSYQGFQGLYNLFENGAGYDS